jgi:hypothetical protein
MHIVCSGRSQPPVYELAPVGRRSPWLLAVLRRPSATAATLLRTGPITPTFVATVVDDVLQAPPGSALDVTFNEAPDAMAAPLVARLLRLASRGIDVHIACAARGDRPLRWRATAQLDDAVASYGDSSPPTAA